MMICIFRIFFVWAFLFFPLISTGFNIKLYSAPSSSSSSSHSSSHHDNTKHCKPITWKSLKKGDLYFVYTGNAWIDRKFIGVVHEHREIASLIKKQAKGAFFFFTAFDKKGRELETIKIILNGRKIKICQPPCVMTRLLKPGEMNEPYSDRIKLASSSRSATFKLVKGALPEGLTLSRHGMISGIPAETGSFHFIVKAASRCGSFRFYPLKIMIDCPEISFETTALQDGEVGIPYHEAIIISGSVPVTTFTMISGTLPPGLFLSSDGMLDGIPTEAGTFHFFIQTINGCGESTSAPFSLLIDNPCVAPTITTTSLPNTEGGTPYTASIETVGGVEPILFQLVSGALPLGLTLSPDGVVSGSTVIGYPGDYLFTIEAVSECGSSSTQEITLHVTNS